VSGTANLYFIAIIPPREICDEVTAFKLDIAEKYNSRKSLKVIPHITLKAPFKLPSENHEQVLQWFSEMLVSVSPFQQELRDFGSFANKRNPVIFVNPEMNPSLHALQREVLLNFVDAFPGVGVSELELKFSPHVTIAYRDLQPKFFKEAWKEYEAKKYYANFEVDCVHLLQHDTKRWNTISELKLKPGTALA
jgi:2'-5' RNA ligase